MWPWPGPTPKPYGTMINPKRWQISRYGWKQYLWNNYKGPMSRSYFRLKESDRDLGQLPSQMASRSHLKLRPYGAIQICLLLLFFWPSVDIFLREFKNWDIQKWVQIYQSVQSGVGKLSCNETALKRCTSTETLWNRKAPSLSSPEDEEIFLPKLPKSWHADVFKGPMVSTAIGVKRYWLPILAYFSSLREAASSAAAPASRADPVTQDSAKGQVTVTSQHNDLPLSHGRVSDHQVSSRLQNNPDGSFVTGVPAQALLLL